MRNLLLVLFCVWSLAKPVAASDVKVAIVGPMTGQFAGFGAQIRAGVEQAVADLNTAGGINNKKIETLLEDDDCDPAKAVAAAAKVARLRVALVVGHFCSRASIPASKLYAMAGILQITPASTHPKLTDSRAGPTVFRLSGRDDRQGVVAADFLVRSSAGSISILHDETNYGRLIARQTQDALKQQGAEQIAFEALSADVTQSVSRLKLAGADTVYFGGSHEKAAQLLRTMRKQGVTAQLVGGDALATQAFWQAGGISANGVLMTDIWDPSSHPAAHPVVMSLRSRAILPDKYTLYAYAVVQAWAQAAAAAASFQATPVSNHLSKLKFKTVIGTFGFDEKGDPDKSFYQLYRWQNGRYRPLD